MLTPFTKTCFILLLSLLTILRLYYKRKYSKVVCLQALSFEPRAIVILRWILGIALCFVMIDMLFFDTTIPYSYIMFPLQIQLIGLIIGLCALGLLWASHHALGSEFSPTIGTNQVKNIVTSGPYRCIRHPMYAAYILFFTGLIALTGSWLFGFLGIAIIGSLIFLRLPYEEAALIKRFPESYVQYKATTGALFPKILLFRGTSYE